MFVAGLSNCMAPDYMLIVARSVVVELGLLALVRLMPCQLKITEIRVDNLYGSSIHYREYWTWANAWLGRVERLMW